MSNPDYFLPRLGDEDWGNTLNNHFHNRVPIILGTFFDMRNGLEITKNPFQFVRILGYHKINDGGEGLFI